MTTATKTTNSPFWQGVRDGAPFILVIAPFSMLFGVVGTEAGLHIAETMAVSVLICIPPFLIALFFQRYLMLGINIGESA